MRRDGRAPLPGRARRISELAAQSLLRAALANHRAGRVGIAAQAYRRLLCFEPARPDGWNFLALLTLQSADAKDGYRFSLRARRLDPDSAAYAVTHGHALLDLGRASEALDVLAMASVLAPLTAATWSGKAAALKALGRIDEAAAAYRAAIALAPGDGAVLYNLALARQTAGSPAEAAALYGRALAAAPRMVDALNNRGQARAELGQTSEALADFAAALAVAPVHVGALINRGNLLRRIGRGKEAISSLEQAVRLAPRNASALNDLAVALWAEGEEDRAIALYRTAVEAAPDRPEIAGNLASALNSAGRYEEAIDAYDQAIRRHPGEAGLKIRRWLSLPPVPESRDQIAELRQAMRGFLADPATARLALADPLAEVGAANFYLVYHGENDRDLAVAISAFYRHAAPMLSYVAPHCATGRTGRRIRLGVCSKYLAGHTIGAMFGDLVCGIDRSRFELFLLRPPGLRDARAAEIASRAEHVIDLPGQLRGAQTRIADLGLDVLLYLDIGMEPFTYFLAHARLAAVQWVTWGHPVTTGISTIDAYLSPAAFEPEGAEAHYSERLVLSSSIPMHYRAETVPPAGRKSDFGLPDDRPLYLCAQNVFKLHPDFDDWLGALLDADPRGMLCLIEGAKPEWTRRLDRRLSARLGPALERVRFLPYMPKDRYMRLLGAADVALDPIHFGGSNTTLGAFSAGTPVVTWPGAYMRGRMTYGIYRTMGVADCIARDAADYAAIAARLANAPEARRDTVAAIRAAMPAVVGTTGAIRDLEELLAAAVAARGG